MKKTKNNEMKDKKLTEVQKELIELNIGLAYSRAYKMMRKYSNCKLTLDKDDFESYALEGLCEAALRFDLSRGVKFSTFAYNYVDNYIKTNVFLENPMIKIPSYSPDKKKMQTLRYMALNNTLQTGNESGCKDSEGNYVNLDSLYNCGKNEIGFEKIEEDMYLNCVTNQLSDKDKAIFKYLVEDGMNLSDIATHLDIHLNTVCRRKKKIAKTVKLYLKNS